MGRAKIIAIEGCDGCGKETQSKLLQEYILSTGKNCKLISFPNYESPSSELVRSFLAGKFKDTTQAQRTTMYSLDRSLTMNTAEMKEFLSNENNVLICDRYMSSLVYDTVDNKGEELKTRFDEIFHIEHDILGVPKPDVIIVMNLDDKYNSKIIDERAKAGEQDIYESDNSFLSKIRRNVRRISLDYNLKKEFKIVPVYTNDDNRRFTIDEVSNNIKEIYKLLEVK